MPSDLLTPPRGAKVFVCYARKNGKLIDWFVPLLRSAGVDVFLDADIEPGDEWESRILAEIRSADRFLLFWTKAAARSKWVRREYEMALTVPGLRIVPIVVRSLQRPDPLPEGIAKYQAIELNIGISIAGGGGLLLDFTIGDMKTTERYLTWHHFAPAVFTASGLPDLNEAGRAASREGNHALAETLFHRSWVEHGNLHSAANEVYEQFLQGKATADEVRAAVYKHGIADGGHGQWLLRQVEQLE